MSSRFTAIVLDLDGTLIDSAPDLHAATVALLMEEELPPPSLAAVTAMIGDGMAKLVERAFAAAGRPTTPTETSLLLRRFREYYEGPGRPRLTRVYPGVHATLERLRRNGLRLGVCTDKVETAATALLEDLGIARLVDVVVGGATVPAQRSEEHTSELRSLMR